MSSLTVVVGGYCESLQVFAKLCATQLFMWAHIHTHTHMQGMSGHQPVNATVSCHELRIVEIPLKLRQSLLVGFNSNGPCFQ
jgi:hypothetical protein